MRTASGERQKLKGGHEGQGNGFGLLVACVWAEGRIDHLLQQSIGNGSSHTTSRAGSARVGSTQAHPTLFGASPDWSAAMF